MFGSVVRHFRAKDKAGHEEEGYRFWCPACSALHAVYTVAAVPIPVHWFSGSVQSPTFSGILVYEHHQGKWIDTEPGQAEGTWAPTGSPVLDCESEVTDGVITYTLHCPHEFAGESVVIPAFPFTIQQADLLAKQSAEYFRHLRQNDRRLLR